MPKKDASDLFESARSRGRLAASRRKFKIPKGYIFLQRVGFKVGIAEFFIDKEEVTNNIDNYSLVKKKYKRRW